MRRLSFVLLLLGGCSFDHAGVPLTGDPIDADPNAPDADPNAPDANPGAPDATPVMPDAMNDGDLDDDGWLDGADNCPTIANPTQHDEDFDTLGDACDNCPAVSNPSQANTTENVLVTGDRVGDACDPHPTTAETIAMFEPFAGFTLPAGWTSDTGSWTVSGDALHQGLTTAGNHLVSYGTSYKDVTVMTRMQLDVVVLDPTAVSDVHSIGPLTRYSASDLTGYICTLYDDAATTLDTILRDALYDTGGTTTLDFISVGSDMTAGQVFDMTATAVGTGISCKANTFPSTATDATHAEGLIALRTNAVAATFPYVLVLQPVP